MKKLNKWIWNEEEKLYVQEGFHPEELVNTLGANKFGDVLSRLSYSPISVRWNNTFEEAQQMRFMVCLHWIKSRLSYLLNVEGKKRKKLIIDLGCSRSIVYQRWRNNMSHFNCPQIYYWGFDSHLERIQQGRTLFKKKKNDSVVYFLGDILKEVRFPARADVIVAMEILEHLPPDKAGNLFKNIRRNLKKTGVAIVSSPNPAEKDSFVWADSEKGHHKEYPWFQAKEMMVNHGFEIIDRVGVLPVRNYFRRTSFPEIRKELVKHLPSSFVNPILLLAEDNMSLNKEWISLIRRAK